MGEINNAGPRACAVRVSASTTELPASQVLELVSASIDNTISYDPVFSLTAYVQ